MNISANKVINNMTIQEDEMVKVGDLTQYSRSVNTIVKIISKTEPREVTSRADRSIHRVCEALVADDTGSIYMTLWDEKIEELEDGAILEITNGYINLFRGSMRLNLGRYGSYKVLDDAPFEDINLDNNLSSKIFEQRNRYRGRPSRRY